MVEFDEFSIGSVSIGECGLLFVCISVLWMLGLVQLDDDTMLPLTCSIGDSC